MDEAPYPFPVVLVILMQPNALCCGEAEAYWGGVLPVGTCEQSLGRDLVPRLSIGTLQLSIRCSSIHLLPRRSFPVCIAGGFTELVVGWPSRELS
jgi:hypothetical protein